MESLWEGDPVQVGGYGILGRLGIGGMRREHTVKSSWTEDFSMLTEESHWTAQVRIRVDSSSTSLHRAMHHHTFTPAGHGMGDLTTDDDAGVIVLPGRAWVTKPTGDDILHPTGVTWIELDLAATDPDKANDLAIVRAASDESNPLRPNVRAATVVDSAEELLDGVPTRRYTLRLDRDAMLQLKADPTWQPPGPLPPPDPATSRTEILWLDGANHLVRFRSEQPPQGTLGAITREARYREWGRPVRIEPPAPNQSTTG
jgi:hypothetical protein